MNLLAKRIGMWAAIIETALSLIYLIGLVILVGSVLSQQSLADATSTQWSNVRDYAAHYTDNRLTLAVGVIVQVSAFAAALTIHVIFLVLHEITDPKKRILTRISSSFTLILVVASSLAYYIQWASVHQAIISGGDLEGLGQFAESNVISPAMATLQLGWAFFYGLATLIVAPMFSSRRIEKWIRAAFLVNGIIGVSVGVAYAFGLFWILPLSLLGLVVTSIAYPLLALYFSDLSQTGSRSVATLP